MLDKTVGVLVDLPAKILNLSQDLFALALRVYVGWQFFKAGLLKFNSWGSTLELFGDIYEVPILPPVLAAVSGTFGELFFPLLLWIGLTTRLAALGLQIVNVVAVIAVLHFFDDGLANSAFADHYLWGLMMLGLTVYGPGRISVDHFLSRQSKTAY